MESLLFTKFDYALMKTALIWKDLSYGRKRKVGAVLVRDNRIIAHGYNGTVQGLPNQMEDEQGSTYPHILHAEENALIFCAKEGIQVKGTWLYCTCLPCSHCAALLAQAGVTRVYYLEHYEGSKGSGLSIFRRKGIRVVRMSFK